MKKILLVLLFVGIGQRLKAQEQFLKLDSIQVINGTLNEVPEPGNFYYRSGTDTINIVSNSNSIIKLKSVLIEVEFNIGHSGGKNTSYSLELNNRQLISNSYTGGGTQSILEYFDLIENENLNLLLYRRTYSSTNSDPYEINYRIELHHYSYE